MSSTSSNPGAFNTSAPGMRSIASRFVQLLRRGDYRGGALNLLADAINLVEARTAAITPYRYRCSCCDHEAHAFRHIFSGGHLVWNSACPACDSRSRHRGLAVLLPKLVDELRPKSILHFAPEPVLRRCFVGYDARYETADLYLEDTTHVGVDLQRLPFHDRSYDLIVCNHVLEHVPNDAIALSEVARVLTPSGAAVLTVPGDFSRRETLYFDGHLPNGHYRDYGRDFVARLHAVFARVDALDMHCFDGSERSLSHAIKRGDLAFVCRRAA